MNEQNMNLHTCLIKTRKSKIVNADLIPFLFITFLINEQILLIFLFLQKDPF